MRRIAPAFAFELAVILIVMAATSAGLLDSWCDFAVVGALCVLFTLWAAYVYREQIKNWIRRRYHPGAQAIASAEEEHKRQEDGEQAASKRYLEDAMRAAREVPWLRDEQYDPVTGKIIAKFEDDVPGMALSLWMERQKLVETDRGIRPALRRLRAALADRWARVRR